MQRSVPTDAICEARERNDLLDDVSPRGARLVQVTTDPALASHHLYPESFMFTPDGQRFVFHRMPVAGESLGDFWLCDTADDFRLRQLTVGGNARAAAVSPDGAWLYYLLDDTLTAKQTVEIKRVALADGQTQTILKHGGVITGTRFTPWRFYSTASISSDGARLCTSACLGDGIHDNPPWGLLVIDVRSGAMNLVFAHPEFWNMHAQYCRSLDPGLSHDILLQHNHGALIDPAGNAIRSVDAGGADIHVIRDDGTYWRDVPLGRDGVFWCTGHQQWRGTGGHVYSAMSNAREHIFEAVPIATDAATTHRGAAIPGSIAWNLTRHLSEARFNHFSGDLSGTRLVLRNQRAHPGDDLRLFTGVRMPGDEPVLNVAFLLNPRNDAAQESFQRLQSNAPRPFFSPDATWVLFHSDVDGGTSQIFVAQMEL